MEQMEEGNENDTANINNITVGNENNIICHNELQPKDINPEINQQHDQNSEIIEDISTMQDSKEVLCQGILLEILEKIVKQPSDPDSPDKPLTSTSQPPQKMIQKVKGKYSK